MKRFFSSITSFFELMGRARAAAELSRMGRYQEARNLISGK